jgi:hypothetical protein
MKKQFGDSIRIRIFCAMLAHTRYMSNKTKTQLYNALILSGLTLFSTLISVSAIDMTENFFHHILTSFVSSGITFFTSLMVQRGITPLPQEDDKRGHRDGRS